MLDYPSRLEKARARMAEKNVGLMYLTLGANLFYLTGIRRQEGHSTEDNRYGDWVTGGFIGLNEGIDLVAARMGGGYFQTEADGKPWFNTVHLIQESEEPLQVLKRVMSRLDLQGKKVALDDRTWAQTALAIQNQLPDTEFILASEIIAPLRMVKEPAELDLMRTAGQVAENVFEKAIARLRPGVTEIDVASEIDYQFRRMGAEYNSFVTGVFFSGPGRDRDVLGAQTPKNTLRPGDSVMFDFGCVYEGYCSDFGRSAFVGEPPAEYIKIHELVLAAQREGMQAMKAGQVTAAQANAIARAVIEDAGYGPNFLHRLGHGIGVTVHEPPFLDVMDHTVLKTNMTFTVEPSILSVPENPTPGNFFSRVEDVVQVTDQGGVSLYTAGRKPYVVA